MMPMTMAWFIHKAEFIKLSPLPLFFGNPLLISIYILQGYSRIRPVILKLGGPAKSDGTETTESSPCRDNRPTHNTKKVRARIGPLVRRHNFWHPLLPF